MRALVEALARRRPLVLVFEDVHWAEPPLLDLVEHLGLQSRDAPLMVLCLAREELLEQRPAVAASRPRAETLELEPLSAGDTRALIDELPAAARGRRAAARPGASSAPRATRCSSSRWSPC